MIDVFCRSWASRERPRRLGGLRLRNPESERAAGEAPWVVVAVVAVAGRGSKEEQ